MIRSKSGKNRILSALGAFLLAVSLAVTGLVAVGCPAPVTVASEPAAAVAANVIFIHPDGANQQHFHAFRLVDQGPDGYINWDRLPQLALYRPHVLDNLQAGSVAGAVAHAAGIKTYFDWFGFDRYGQPITTITQLARDAGFATGLINSGCLTEPGTAVFVASAEDRGDREYIMLQVAESGVDVILGGGERYFLPKGVPGRHGMGRRADGRNLIEEMKAKGYTVVFTREELAAVNPAETDKLLGLFAYRHTFNDRTEEHLAEHNLPLFWPWAPCVGEMTDKAIQILSRNQTGFLLVVEHEGTDNFADGANNAKGTIEAVRRTDRAIGVAMDFAEAQGNTLVITAADSDAGGMNIWAPSPGEIARWEGIVPATASAPGWHPPYVNLAAADGIGGTGTAPFTTPCGMQFGIVWAGQMDAATTMIARAYGPKSYLVTGIIDNTDIFHIMMKALGLD
ncbi:MAG: alkaline phosphatase [Dehalococcoidia bacterium]